MSDWRTVRGFRSLVLIVSVLQNSIEGGSRLVLKAFSVSVSANVTSE
jgi:hypothetical protein